MTDPGSTPNDVLRRLLTKLEDLDLATDERQLLWAILKAAEPHVTVVPDPAPPNFLQEFEGSFTPTRPNAAESATTAESGGSTYSISRSSYTTTSISRSGTVVCTHYLT
jgi:hypothetical protein